jgi:hypothetical protein
MTEVTSNVGSLSEVEIPETDQEDELALYRRYRALGGPPIDDYEKLLKDTPAEKVVAANSFRGTPA